AANTNVDVQLNNRWWLHAGTTLGHLGTTLDDRRARGGPAVRVDPIVSSWAEWDGDSRPVVVPALWTNYWRGDGGRSESVNLGSQVSVRIASQLNTTTGSSRTPARSRAGSTSSSSIPTSCCDGNIGPARLCSSSGRKGGATSSGRRGRGRSPVISATSSRSTPITPSS